MAGRWKSRRRHGLAVRPGKSAAGPERSIATSGSVLSDIQNKAIAVDAKEEARANDLEAWHDALVDAAGVGAGLWFSYLFMLFYLLIAVGGVSHIDLFFENPVKLPFLNVELPLMGFFALGPALFLVVHSYILLHFVMLAGKAGAFNTALCGQVMEEDRLRRQLPINIFVQLLAGPLEVRKGVTGIMLRLVSWTSLILGPLALLLFFQVQFLPYHDETITWWHRFVIIGDLVVLWRLWPLIMGGGAIWSLRRKLISNKKVVVAGVASITTILWAVTVASFPGETIYDRLPPVHFVPCLSLIPCQQESGSAKNWTSIHEIMVAGPVDFITRKPLSRWSNHLVLPAMGAVDHVKFDSESKISIRPEIPSLRGRHFEKAVLSGASLRKADFTGAHLQGASLSGADLQDAKFDDAELRGAFLRQAYLQGASFGNAELKGANLEGAHLQGASFISANLQGAMLSWANLQGAGLNSAQFQGATLDWAHLEGASLMNAQLQGASLDFAEFQGATLDFAQLQGASLLETRLDGASMESVYLWRVDSGKVGVIPVTNPSLLEQFSPGKANIKTPKIAPRYKEVEWAKCLDQDKQNCSWTSATFRSLKRLFDEVAAAAPFGASVDEELKWRARWQTRIDGLDPTKPVADEAELGAAWEALASRALPRESFERGRSEQMRVIGCNTKAPPYVIRGLMSTQQDTFQHRNPYAANLAAAFLDEDQCPGARGLAEAEKSDLRETVCEAAGKLAADRTRMLAPILVTELVGSAKKISC